MEEYLKLKNGFIKLRKKLKNNNTNTDRIEKSFIDLFSKLDSLNLEKYIKLDKLIKNKPLLGYDFQESIEFCENIFKQINFRNLIELRYNLNPLEKDNNKIYGKIIEKAFINNEQIRIEISLTTKYMMDFDNMFLAKDGVYKLAIELWENINILNLENKNIENIKNIEKRINDIINEINEKLIALSGKSEKIDFFTLDETYNIFFADIILNIVEHLCRPYFFEFITELDKKTFENLEVEQYEFYEFEFIDSSNSEFVYSSKEDILIGYIIFASSPFIRKRMELKLSNSNPVSKHINKTNQVNYKTTNNIINKNINLSKVGSLNSNELGSNLLDLKELLKSINSSNISSIKYKINHVGQGFNSYLLFNNNTTIMFDIGYSMCPEDKTIKLGKHSYVNNKPRLVILSHWDVDHILGIADCDNSIFDAPWIVPDLNYNIEIFSLSAIRLNLYLKLQETRKNSGKNIKKQYLYNIGESFNSKKIDSFVVGDYKFNLYKGKGKDISRKDKFINSKKQEIEMTKNSNEKNNIGIYLEMIGIKKILCTGDCDYNSLYNVNHSGNCYDYLIASHHGSYADAPKFLLKNRESIVIVPVGKNYDGLPVYLNNLDIIKTTFKSKIIETQYEGDYVITLK